MFYTLLHLSLGHTLYSSLRFFQAAIFCAAQTIRFANVSLAVSAESFLKDASILTSQL